MAAASEEPRISVDFLPVLDCREETPGPLYVQPSQQRSDGTSLDAASLLTAGTEGKGFNEPLVRRNLETVVNAGLRKAEALSGEGQGRKVIIPLNGVALAKKAIAGDFANLCRSASEKSRSHVVFEVTNLLDEQRMSFLDDVAIVLYPFCQEYHARVSLKSQSFKVYATCNYTGISVDLLNKPWPLDAVGPHMKSLFARAEESRLKVCVHGVGNSKLAEFFRELGVHYMSGEGVSLREKRAG
ncbi:MAG: hypothetical protein ABT940_09315 [Alphaproteobacteria bacterium]